MNLSLPLPVTVGVDGTEASGRALRWAVDEAHRRRSSLHIVHVQEPGDRPTVAMTSVDDLRLDADSMKGLAEDLLANAERTARLRELRVAVHSTLLTGDAADELAAGSGDAALLVIGWHTASSRHYPLLGGIAERLVAIARCPVVVVRSVTEGTGPVVAAIGGGSHSAETLLLAGKAAASRRAVLHVIHVANLGDFAATPQSIAVVPERLQTWSESTLERAGLTAVTVTSEIVLGDLRQQLTDHAKAACLIVLGSPHLDPAALLGAGSEHAEGHAGCPVMVRPATEAIDLTEPVGRLTPPQLEQHRSSTSAMRPDREW
jgi:nucleotide-binding universal stress UspA family protein